MEILDTAVFSSRPVRRTSGVYNAGAFSDAQQIEHTFGRPQVPAATIAPQTSSPAAASQTVLQTAQQQTPPAASQGGELVPLIPVNDDTPPMEIPPADAEPSADSAAEAVAEIDEDTNLQPTPTWTPPQISNRLFRFPAEQQPHHWMQLDSLYWWVNGASVPVIATTSPAGTPGLQAGVIGQPQTGVLWGGGDLFDGSRSGFRLRGGEWYEEDDGSGWQAEFLVLGSSGHNFLTQSAGQPILARPFFNEAAARQDSQLIAFPGVSEGALAFNAETRMYSLSLSLWGEILDEDNGRRPEPVSTRNGRHSRLCWKSGYESRSLGLRIGPRFMHHDDTVLFDESATSLTTGNQFRILDSFKTENSFLGGEIGLRGRRQKGPISLDLAVNVAVGANRQELDVSGYTAITSGTGTTFSSSGFYAQSTNSGSWDENRFSVVPSLELALGYETPSGWRFSVGYDLIYWTNVLRAAEQIDPTLHPDQFPPATVPSAATRPAVLLNESDYLAHGLSFAIERRW